MPDAPEPAPKPSSEPETRSRIDMKQVSTGGAQESSSAALPVDGNSYRTLLDLINKLPTELKLMIFALFTLDPIYAYVFSQTFGLEDEWITKRIGILADWRITFLSPNLVKLQTVSTRLVTQRSQGDVLKEYFHCYGFRSTILWERSKKFKIESWGPDEFAVNFDKGDYFRPQVDEEMDWKLQCDHWVFNLYLRHHHYCHGRRPPNVTWRDTIRDCILHCDLRAWWKAQYKSDFVAISLEEKVYKFRTAITPWDGKETDRILMTVGNLAIYQKYAALCLLAVPATELGRYDIPLKIHRDFFKRGEQCAKSLGLDRDVEQRESWKELALQPATQTCLTNFFALSGSLFECDGKCMTLLD